MNLIVIFSLLLSCFCVFQCEAASNSQAPTVSVAAAGRGAVTGAGASQSCATSNLPKGGAPTFEKCSNKLSYRPCILPVIFSALFQGKK